MRIQRNNEYEQSQYLHILNYVRVIITHVMRWLEGLVAISVAPSVVRGLCIILHNKNSYSMILFLCYRINLIFDTLRFLIIEKIY